MSDDVIISLQNLSTEILLMIFGNLSIADLLNLKKTCTRFYKIIHGYWDILIFKRRENFLVTNQSNEIFQSRSRRLLAPFEKHRISNNWQIGRYVGKYIYLSRYITFFHLEKNAVWYGTDGCITCCHRSRYKVSLRKIKYKLDDFDCSDTCKFVVKNNHVASATGQTLRLYSLEEAKFTYSISLRDMNASSIDMESNFIAVGSREGLVQLFTHSHTFGPAARIKFKDRIWSLAFNCDKLAIGTAANDSRTCIALVDTERGEILQEFYADEPGAGVLQLKWDNPSTIWSGGYDMCLNRWDLRTGECVQKFLDPWGSKVNCFDYDFVNTVITGCDDSRATLWDTRKDRYVQMYYMKSGTVSRSRSPIYSLCFEPESLFATTNSHLNILDFSVKQGCVEDYSKIYSTQLVI